MSFSKRLKDLMELKGVSAAELARKLGKSDSQISQWRIGVRVPAQDNFLAIAKALDVPPEMLDPKTSLQAHKNVESTKLPQNKIPVISWVQAGKWSEAIDSYPAGVAEDWIPYETKSKGVFALKVIGNSMEPEYREGDIIMVNPQVEARAGDDVIAKFGDDVTFKRLKQQNGTILLSPLNPSHPDIIVTGKDLKQYKTIGVVEGLMRKRKRGK